MKLSTNFVKDYVDIDVDVIKLAEDMTNVGNEYETAGKLINAEGLVIGKVIECVEHPDSNHLHVCKVDVGNEILQIVCGAPNVREGIKVIVAKIGATLPEMTIKAGKIRGIESNGMLCSLQELGLENKFLKREDIEGISVLKDNAKIGENPIKYLGLDDEVIDFELTANRGDLLSILGMAYEIGAIYDKPVKDIDLSHKEIEENINNSFKVEVKTDNCSMFLAKKVIDVKIKESPDFIKNRLIASGIRPINNVVDISNYVMLETGQPLHFYDFDKLGNTIIVRQAQNEEKLTTLDGQERILGNDDIVIANNNEPIGLAGVMGGLETEVEENTKNIIIESAIFDSVKVRLTSKKILRSEASNRFEKGLDYKRTYMAIERSCNLLEKYADAKIVSGIVEYDNIAKKENKIDITVKKINDVLGINIPQESIIDIFRKIGFKTDVNEENITVTVPSRRIDISIKEDLIEEIGRFYGLDNIKGKRLILPVKPGSYNKTKRSIRNKLAMLGLNETLSYSLIPESEVFKYTTKEFEKVKILDPITEERNTLRYSLIPSLKMIYDYNKARNLKDISIFEIGKSFYKKDGEYGENQALGILMSGVYKNGIQKENVDFYVIKGIMENLLNYLGYEDRYRLEVSDLPKELHPGVSASIMIEKNKIGIIGKIHPTESKDDIYIIEIYLDILLDIKHKKMQYKEISKYPNVVKDVAFIVDNAITSEEISNIIKKSTGNVLKNIEVFDVYTGDNIEKGKKSIAYKLTFSDSNKTLTDEEVTILFNKLIENVCNKIGAELRDK